MTDVSASVGSGRTLVWDASPLHHAIKADRIDVLGDIAQGGIGGSARSVTTATVVEELRYHGLSVEGMTAVRSHGAPGSGLVL